MSLFNIAFFCWLIALCSCCFPRSFLFIPRFLLCLGCVFALSAVISTLPVGTVIGHLPFLIAGEMMTFYVHPSALWLMGFGLFPAVFACWFSYLIHSPKVHRYWLMGAASSLLGALGVFGLQDGISFLIAWELMSFGGALMLLAENKSLETGESVFFMLALLEVGAVALMVAILLLSGDGLSLQFAGFSQHASQFSPLKQSVIGILLVIGFGAKLGVLPFYEWLPKAYSAGSGITGALLSGVILNAAFFGLMRGLFAWLPQTTWGIALGIIVIILGSFTAVLTILQSFQQTDWRKLLSFSSAENAAIAITMIGAALLFQYEHLTRLAALAGIVAMIHMAAHSLAKGTLFLVADGIYLSKQNYLIGQNGLLKNLGWLVGLGALFGAMSLSAMPPQAGFVSEWYVFQTLFQGFNLSYLAARFAFILAGISLALTAAFALATFVKAFGIGLLGANAERINPIPFSLKVSIFMLGFAIPLLAVGMLQWLNALSIASLSWFGVDSTADMHTGLLLVPLSAKFAFISPMLLVIVTPLLALVPLALIGISKTIPIKHAPVWFGGLTQDPKAVATTAYTFSNAMHHFYRFIYLHSHGVEKTYHGKPYFVERVLFHQRTKEVFTSYIFMPLVHSIKFTAKKIRLFQSGNLNFYNAVIGILFFLILLYILI